MEGSDYTVRYENNTNVGTAKILITGVNNYGSTVYKEFMITKAKQTMMLKRVAKTVKAKKKKAFAVVKVSKAKGTVTDYNISKSKAAKKLVVNKKTGKVKVPAKVKAGTYKLKVRAKVDGKVSVKVDGKAQSVQNYESGKQDVTLKVRVA